MSKAVYVGFKFGHMGSHAGYDTIREYAGYDIHIDCQRDYDRMQRFLGRRSIISRAYGVIIGSRLWWVELRCLFLSLRVRNAVFHFVYAENIYRYLGWFRWLGFRIVCTYHQPKEFFRRRPRFLRGMRQTDKIIVLSEEQVERFRAWKGDSRVYAISHGVDTEFFRPNETIRREKEILMVGNWLRDFKVANATFLALLQLDHEIQIHVVATSENLAGFAADPRLHLHSGISDEELVYRYQSAGVLFLPLARFVANNAVLEAAAVGVRILISTGQRDRVLPEHLVEYVPLEVEAGVSRLTELLDESDPASDARRTWVVEHLGWRSIGGATARVLRGT